MDSPGFWTDRAAGASVDWCEPNYLHSAYVAEWWNSGSSLTLVALGVSGVLHARRILGRHEPRFVLAFLSLAVIGLGSVAFHATLLRPAQAMDELPMVFATLIATYALRFRALPFDPPASSLRSVRRFQLGLVTFAVLLTASYFSTNEYWAFVAVFGVLLCYVAFLTAKVVIRGGSPLVRRLFACAVAFHLFAPLGLWLPEHVWLGCGHPLQALELHAIYHLCTGFGTYAWMLAVVVDRREVIDGRFLPIGHVSVPIDRSMASAPACESTEAGGA